VLARVALGAALALPLLAHASVGWYARYVADDYCWAGVLRTQGFLQAQVHWYTIYSPRYAFTFLVNLVELAGPAIVPWLPGVAIVVWVAVLAWALRQLGLELARGLLLAEVIVLATLHTAPDVAQSLYWQTGMLTYSLPLILATLLAGIVARAARSGALGVPSLLACVGLTFMAGGLAETYLIPQNVALTLALMLALSMRRRVVAIYLGAALAGGVLALLAIVIAPATGSRVGGGPADLWLSLSAAIATAAYQAGRLVRYFPLVALLCLAVPWLLRICATPFVDISNRAFAAVTAIAAVTVVFCYFPSFYASNGNPPARSLIVPGFVMVAYLLYLGFAIAARLPRELPRWAFAAAAAALVIVPVGIALSVLPERAVAAEAAALWDREDASIRGARDAGTRNLTVAPRPRYLGEAFVSTNRDDWFNSCVARYYGLDSIVASDVG
jgi:hypothetical protein